MEDVAQCAAGGVEAGCHQGQADRDYVLARDGDTVQFRSEHARNEVGLCVARGVLPVGDRAVEVAANPLDGVRRLLRLAPGESREDLLDPVKELLAV